MPDRAVVRDNARDIVIALGVIAISTAIGLLLRDVFGVAEQALLQVLAIVVGSTLVSRPVSVLAAVVAVCALDVFFIPPYLTFAVSELHHLMTLGVFLAVGLVVSGLTPRARARAQAAEARERQAAALFAMTRDLAGLTTADAIADAALRHVRALGLHAEVLRSNDGRPISLQFSQPGHLEELLGATASVALERARLAEIAEAGRLVFETERTRTTLLSAVSHDLRTPLAAITGAASALLGGHDDPAGRDVLLRTVRDESERLGRLIGGLVDLTRLESAPEAKKEWVPLDEVVASAIDRLHAQVGPREVRVTLPDEIVLVPMDPVLVDQLLFNLLENTMKYAPSGPIDLAGRRWQDGVRVDVMDRGPGLPEGSEELVFQRFWRAPDGGRADGSGLGLAIAAAIARIHGGTVFAHPRDGGGAVFGFTLPITGEAPPMPAEEA